MRPTIVLRVACSGALLLAACSSSGSSSTAGPGAPPTGGPAAKKSSLAGSALFEEFGSCDDFLAWSKDRMLERVTPYGLGQRYWYPGGPVMTESAGTTPAATTPAQPTGDTTAGQTTGGTSTTNTQEEGVDEGDLAETDGRFVYTIIGGRLRSVDVHGGTVVSDLAIPPGATDMILDGTSLLLVGQDWSSADSDTVASTYSVTNGVLELLGRTHLEGRFISVRSVDHVARIVLDQPFATRLPFVQPTFSTDNSEDEALKENKAVIEAATADALIPRTYTEGPNGGSGPLTQALSCEQVGHPTEYSGLSTVWVASVDLSAEAPAATGAAAVVATAQTVYASTDHLYIATIPDSGATGDTVPVGRQSVRTAIHQFDLSAEGGAGYVASGAIDGSVLNSYAMSESDGVLRVATTTDAGGFGQSRESGVHVLRANGESLDEIGTLGGLGRGEGIQGVRFVGDRGYVVTFRQVDPLFVIDLSDPAKPTLQGELTMPGFSTYLHPIDDHRLLAVGYAGTDNGQITGVQLSLFDVTDTTAPKLLDTLPFANSSNATFDPHAFLWWPETGAVVVPRGLDCIEDCSSAFVATVGDADVTELGRLMQWHQIERTMVVDGELVAISSYGVQAFRLDTLAQTEDIVFPS